MEKKVFEKADILFAFGMLACGFLYWNLRLFALGAGVSVFTAFILAATLLYFKCSGVKQTRKSLFWLALVIFTAGAFSIFDALVVKGFEFLFLMAAYVYWVCVSTGRQIVKELSVYLIGDAFSQGIIVPFGNFGCCFGGIAKAAGKSKNSKGVLSLLLGILIILPLMIAVVRLLVSADLAFESFMSGVYEFFGALDAMQYVLQFLLGIPVACYIYGLVYGNIHGSRTDVVTKSVLEKAAAGVRIAPRLTIYTALTAFNVLYLIYFAVQAAYFFSAFSGTLPEHFTYAEYARRGFFELCTVAGINLGVMALTYITIKREPGEEPKALRMQTALISLFTMLLIVTAFSKMAMYIQSYGLTQLRVYTSWFMALLFFIFVVVMVRQLKRFNASKVIVIGFILLFMALTYGNTDGMIAKYNLERFKAGTLEMMDSETLEKLSDAAVPYVYAVYESMDTAKPEERALKQRLLQALQGEAQMRQDAGDDFRDWNFQKHRADEIREAL